MPTIRPTGLRGYQRGWLRADVIAGGTVAAYLVPQAMAYAQLAGLPAVAGLWAVLGPLAVYALLGSSRLLSVGPESTTALMTAIAVGAVAGGDPARYIILATALALMVGVLYLLAWLIRLGFLADLLSRPVLIGYLTGIAVIMMAGQLGRMTGAAVSGESPFAELVSAVRQAGSWHPVTVGLSLVALALLLASARWAPRLPAPILVMVLAAAVTAMANLDEHGVSLIGSVPSGLPTPGLPSISAADLTALILPALGVAFVGYADTVLTGRAFATKRHEEIDADAELLALGTANLASGLLHGFPVSSSGSRTAVADAAGAKSQAYSLVALALVIVTLLVGGPVLSTFPTAALGALVVYAALRLVELTEFRRIGRFRRSELILALATCVGVVTLGVLYGVLVAVALSVLDLFRRVTRPHAAVLGIAPGVPGMHDLDDYPNARPVPGLVVYRYDSPLFFANAEDFRRRALAAVDTSPEPVRWLLLNAEANIEIDITAIDALDALRDELAERGVVLALARVKQELRRDLEAAGFLDRLGPERFFLTLPTAVQAYRDWSAESQRPKENSA
jgi:SulP family sulfate permease